MPFDTDGTRPLDVVRSMNSRYGPGGATADDIGHLHADRPGAARHDTERDGALIGVDQCVIAVRRMSSTLPIELAFGVAMVKV